jgi:hypothetical protein
MRRGYEKKRRRSVEAQAQAGSFLTGLRIGWKNWMDPTLEEQVEIVSGDWWPEWWGSSDEAGASPYDYAPPTIVGEKKRVLFLTSESRRTLHLKRRKADGRLQGLPGENEHAYIRNSGW